MTAVSNIFYLVLGLIIWGGLFISVFLWVFLHLLWLLAIVTLTVAAAVTVAIIKEVFNKNTNE